jgi:hypothetical protein
MKKKIDARLRKLVLNQQRNNPELGVRKLADLLEKKYAVSLSKSSIHCILQSKGTKLKKGPKEAKLAYEKNSIPEAGLLLLRCIDSQIGFFDYLSDELNIYTPKLKKELLKKFIILTSLAALSAEKLNIAVRNQSYLRLAGLYRFPVKKFNYFKKRIVRYQPILELKPVHKNLTIIAGIRIIFNNSRHIYLDSKLATLWDSLPQTDYFFSSLKKCRDRVKQMLSEKLLIIGYTKSFDYLSGLVFELIKGAESEVGKIQFLDKNSKLIKEIVVNEKINFMVGYYPKGVSKGIKYDKERKHYNRVHVEQLGTFYLMNIYSNFLQTSDRKYVKLFNVLINRKNYGLPNWGLITSSGKLSRQKTEQIFKSYIYLWPDLENNLFEGAKEIEASFVSNEVKKNGVIGIIPGKLVFLDLSHFSRVGQLLAVIFKEFVTGIEPKRRRGFFEKGKDYLLLTLPNMPNKVKKVLDQQAFFLDQRRVFFR